MPRSGLSCCAVCACVLPVLPAFSRAIDRFDRSIRSVDRLLIGSLIRSRQFGRVRVGVFSRSSERKTADSSFGISLSLSFAISIRHVTRAREPILAGRRDSAATVGGRGGGRGAKRGRKRSSREERTATHRRSMRQDDGDAELLGGHLRALDAGEIREVSARTRDAYLCDTCFA